MRISKVYGRADWRTFMPPVVEQDEPYCRQTRMIQIEKELEELGWKEQKTWPLNGFFLLDDRAIMVQTLANIDINMPLGVGVYEQLDKPGDLKALAFIEDDPLQPPAVIAAQLHAVQCQKQTRSRN